MNKERLEAYQVQKNLKKLEEEVGSEREIVWEMNRHRQIERDRRNERGIAMEVYIESSNSVKYTMNVQTPNQKLPIQAI